MWTVIAALPRWPSRSPPPRRQPWRLRTTSRALRSPTRRQLPTRPAMRRCSSTRRLRSSTTTPQLRRRGLRNRWHPMSNGPILSRMRSRIRSRSPPCAMRTPAPANCRKQAGRIHSTYQRMLDERPLGSRRVMMASLSAPSTWHSPSSRRCDLLRFRAKAHARSSTPSPAASSSRGSMLAGSGACISSKRRLWFSSC